MTEQDCMRQAIRKAQEGIAAGQSPFGAIIVHEGQVVAGAHNVVWKTTDPTAHAEVACIRQAALALETIALRGCVMYTTTEPCPMCMSAIHWAKIDRVVFGATIADATAAGFSELAIDAQVIVQLGRSPVVVQSGLLQTECAALFQEWKQKGLCKAY